MTRPTRILPTMTTMMKRTTRRRCCASSRRSSEKERRRRRAWRRSRRQCSRASARTRLRWATHCSTSRGPSAAVRPAPRVRERVQERQGSRASASREDGMMVSAENPQRARQGSQFGSVGFHALTLLRRSGTAADVIFKNQAAGVDKQDRSGFVNDLLRESIRHCGARSRGQALGRLAHASDAFPYLSCHTWVLPALFPTGTEFHRKFLHVSTWSCRLISSSETCSHLTCTLAPLLASQRFTK